MTTHGQFREDVIAFGSALAKRGLHPGQVVCIFAQNSAEYLTSMLGCVSLGAAVSPVNNAFNAAEVQRQVRNDSNDNS